jgi:hypothetical protein
MKKHQLGILSNPKVSATAPKSLGSLPNGFWPIVHVFGVDQYRILYNPYRESWSRRWWNDSPNDGNWPVFIEGVAVPQNQAPWDWRTNGGLLDQWPRTVYYGGPCTRSAAAGYRRSFENWAASLGYAYETAVVPVQPNVYGMRHPSTDFVWYIANEQRPPTQYRYIRPYNGNYFRWVDQGYDTYKYGNYYNQHRA